MGTVDFMSPEQGFSSKNVDGRADIYSLGATLFFLLARKVMFPGNSAFEKLLAHREAPIPSLYNSRVGISPNLEIAFMKMVAKKVEDRYASMTEVISALSRLQTEIGENPIATKDLATTNFERGSYPETIDVAAVITNKGKEGNKETDKHIGEKTLAFISSFLHKTYKPKVIVVTGIIGLMFLVLLLMVFMKLGTKVKEKEQIAERVKAKQKEPLKKETSGKEELVDLGKGINLEMVLIPAGKFKMGDPGAEHEVTLTKPFYMGKYEVTQEQWEEVMGNNPSLVKGEKLPMTNVSWNDCQGFIQKLNAKTNGGYRLPTEAEWEYACRAGTTTAYSYGDNITKIDANYGPEGKSVEVGSYKANAFGLYDMHGNVLEWCEDRSGEYPAGAVTDPKGIATGERRVLRGGSFYQEFWSASSCLRNYASQSTRGNNWGFRLAMTK